MVAGGAAVAPYAIFHSIALVGRLIESRVTTEARDPAMAAAGAGTQGTIQEDRMAEGDRCDENGVIRSGTDTRRE